MRPELKRYLELLDILAKSEGPIGKEYEEANELWRKLTNKERKEANTYALKKLGL